MTKTFKELNKFSTVFKELLIKNPNLLETKLGYALKRFEDLNCLTPFKDFNFANSMVRIDHALTDKITGAILKEQSIRGFAYDKAGLKAVMLAEESINKEWENKEFEITPFFCKRENIPENITLTEEQEEVLKGLVLE